MVAFRCNICGAYNERENFATEPPSCACGSNVRVRALVHLLSLEILGESMIAADFPRLRGIRGFGMSDKACYANLLADKFDYTNTYYDQEPRLDFTEEHPALWNSVDFILSSDVLEHIAPPYERALAESCRLLKPHGFFVGTVFCNPADQMREHFPDLYDYRIVKLDTGQVLINRRRDGALETHEDLIFHGGHGATLEMREFGITELQRGFKACGFQELTFLTEDVPEIGVIFDADVSQPFLARKAPFVFDRCSRSQMIQEWKSASNRAYEAEVRADFLAQQVRMAMQSKWLKLGSRLGLGPRFVLPD